MRSLRSQIRYSSKSASESLDQAGSTVAENRRPFPFFAVASVPFRPIKAPNFAPSIRPVGIATVYILRHITTSIMSFKMSSCGMRFRTGPHQNIASWKMPTEPGKSPACESETVYLSAHPLTDINAGSSDQLDKFLIRFESFQLARQLFHRVDVVHGCQSAAQSSYRPERIGIVQ